MLDFATNRRRLRQGTRALAREVDVGEARVFADHGFQWDGARNVWMTRARTSFVLGVGPSFDIRPRGFISRMLGIEFGSPSGDPCFDDFFVVRSPTARDTYDALTTRARSLLATSFEDARLVSNGRTMVLWREADFGREADAESAVEVVVELARYQSAALSALRDLPGAVWVPAVGPWDDRRPPAVIVPASAPVRVEPVVVDGRPAFAASAPCGRSTEPFRVQIGESGVVTGDPGVFPSSVGGAVPRVGASVIECDTARVSLTWPGLETRRERLLAGVRLISAFARTQSSGCYR